MASTILKAMEAAGERPPNSASQTAKIQYAVRLSNALAQLLADALRQRFPGILPADGGTGLESPSASAKGTKKLDVNYSTPSHGLGLGVSIKTISHRDNKSGRYTHNMKRVDEELLAEAIDYHVRQPYAVLIAIYFLPMDGANDGRAGPSSFGSWVRTFYSRAGRDDPDARPELFERIFIGLFDPEGENRGKVRFFDVREPPPRNGLPSPTSSIEWEELVAQIGREYERRNGPPFQWAEDI